MRALRVILALLAVVLLVGASMVLFWSVWAGAGMGAFSNQWGAAMAYAVDPAKLAEMLPGKPVPDEIVLNAELRGFVGYNLNLATLFGVGTMGCVAVVLVVLAVIPWDTRRTEARP